MQSSSHKKGFYSGLVWILSGGVLTIYGTMGLLNTSVPGVEELVAFASSANGFYIYLAAFAAMFIEGLYLIGILGLLEIVFSVAFGFLLFGERIELVALVGILMIIGATAYPYLESRKGET